MDLTLKENEKAVIAVGIDLSLTKAGVSVVVAAGSRKEKGPYTSWKTVYDVATMELGCEQSSTDVRSRIESYRVATSELIDHIFRPIYGVVLNFHATQAVDILFAIEGYSYASIGVTHKTGEFGSIFRQGLLVKLDSLQLATRWEAAIVEVPPTVLKKFATGKGNCKKAEMVSVLSRKYDIELATDDEADAFALSLIGLAVQGMAVTTKHERLIVANMQQHIFRDVTKHAGFPCDE